MVKKTISLLLALVMLFCIGATAFADENQDLEEARAAAKESIETMVGVSDSDVIRVIAKNAIDAINAATTIDEINHIRTKAASDITKSLVPPVRGSFVRLITSIKNFKWFAWLTGAFMIFQLWFENIGSKIFG